MARELNYTLVGLTGDCSNTNQGAFKIEIDGTAPPYSIEWIRPRTDTVVLGAGVTTYTETSLSGGSYVFTIIDSCSDPSNVEQLVQIHVSSGFCTSVSSVSNTVCNGEKIPIWASDYVLADYGTGAIMAVPAHDQRDLDFAKAMKLPVRVVIDTGLEDPITSGIATDGDGKVINSGSITGLAKDEAISRIISELADKKLGKATKNYRLRDWLISRQRFWGTPIPIIHCDSCGLVPVPQSQLPVELPDAKGLDLKPKGTSPLGAASDWVNVACPKCNAPAKRDADTMDTFVDSSWYFLRYTSVNNHDVAFDKKSVQCG